MIPGCKICVIEFMNTKSIYSCLERLLHIKRTLEEKLGRDPTINELSRECKIHPEAVTKILRAADGFGCSWHKTNLSANSYGSFFRMITWMTIFHIITVHYLFITNFDCFKYHHSLFEKKSDSLLIRVVSAVAKKFLSEILLTDNL